MKHTKGEWKVDSCVDNNKHYAVSALYPDAVDGDEYMWKELAPVYVNDTIKDERIGNGKANAKLIAAAPDMFNALQIAYDYLSQNCFEDYDHWKEVQLAIKKATD
jgi:hypothetical protein